MDGLGSGSWSIKSCGCMGIFLDFSGFVIGFGMDGRVSLDECMSYQKSWFRTWSEGFGMGNGSSKSELIFFWRVLFKESEE